MSYKIYFKHNLDVKINSSNREEISFLKITQNNFKQNSELIQQSIDKFHSQIEWNEMWDLDECEVRLNQNEILYLLLDSDIPNGHVWYDSYYLYNAFVSETRTDGDSIWFIQETMWDMKKIFNLKHISLYVDDWNIRAIKFWKKLGFVELT